MGFSEDSENNQDKECKFSRIVALDSKLRKQITLDVFLNELHEKESFFISAKPSQNYDAVNIRIVPRHCDDKDDQLDISLELLNRCAATNSPAVTIGWTRINIALTYADSLSIRKKRIQERKTNEISLQINLNKTTTYFDFDGTVGFVNCFSDVKKWFVKLEEEKNLQIPVVFEKNLTRLEIKSDSDKLILYIEMKKKTYCICVDEENKLTLKDNYNCHCYLNASIEFNILDLNSSLFAITSSVTVAMVTISSKHFDMGSFFVRTSSSVNFFSKNRRNVLTTDLITSVKEWYIPSGSRREIPVILRNDLARLEFRSDLLIAPYMQMNENRYYMCVDKGNDLSLTEYTQSPKEEEIFLAQNRCILNATNGYYVLEMNSTFIENNLSENNNSLWLVEIGAHFSYGSFIVRTNFPSQTAARLTGITFVLTFLSSTLFLIIILMAAVAFIFYRKASKAENALKYAVIMIAHERRNAAPVLGTRGSINNDDDAEYDDVYVDDEKEKCTNEDDKKDVTDEYEFTIYNTMYGSSEIASPEKPSSTK